ncbi:MAG TPA: hypothetical protein ENI73_08925 [Spirochaetes bacterium]|nr:hypothetical protein [Spirochaetota bacterium]
MKLGRKKDFFLRVLEVLYQFDQKQQNDYLGFDHLFSRFKFNNIENGKIKVTEVLEELIEYGYIQESDEKMAYSITDEGISHCEEYNELDTDENDSLPSSAKARGYLGLSILTGGILIVFVIIIGILYLLELFGII